ncbi:hypothetical protein BKA00_005951 [Actinomadura coerulea]|uniref:Ricin B lectin domain-containing protein n=1 Tax=Actinomadura coerulea TaxID=46159 RepID=A0A7X0G5D2_9ACTN|nr:hypothetical protein [Actinomadura coerulea]MBB6399037.1 hypothetical protein [Actinomadura coerulea]GGQ22969.1 hypothetical protein GCM10010187_44140 [Actinomadura coerulea]
MIPPNGPGGGILVAIALVKDGLQGLNPRSLTPRQRTGMLLHALRGSLMKIGGPPQELSCEHPAITRQAVKADATDLPCDQVRAWGDETPTMTVSSYRITTSDIHGDSDTPVHPKGSPLIKRLPLAALALALAATAAVPATAAAASTPQRAAQDPVCLDATNSRADNTNVRLWRCMNHANQKWVIRDGQIIVADTLT